MRLRRYQNDAISGVGGAFESHDSTLLVMATGLGKTVVFAHIARNWLDRVLIIAHREELIQQGADKVQAITGESPAVEMAESRSDETGWLKSRVVLGSVQTLSRTKRREKFAPDAFGLIVVDEAHHAVASSYRQVLDYFSCAKLLGVTATPRRADDAALGQVFQSVAYEYGIADAVEDGWLVPVRQQVIAVKEIDFSRARSLAGDFNEGDLEAILTQEKHLHAVAEPTVKECGDRPGLVFCVSVAHAELMAGVLNRYKRDSAKALSGKTDRDERRDVVREFKEGRLQYLVNCGLFLEGFDAPTTAAVVMARPTKSLGLYTQILGRGTRPLPGVVDAAELADEAALRRAAIAASAKPDMLVLDFAGNAGRHKIVTAADVLGGKYGQAVRDYAKKTMEEEESSDMVGHALDRAADELDFIDEQSKIEAEMERRARLTARVKYDTQDVSPFDRRRVAPGGNGPTQPKGDMATAKQVWRLCKLGWNREKAMRLSKKAAGTIIGQSKR